MVETENIETFLAKADSQNRITIPKNVREILGIAPGVKIRAKISVVPL